MTALARLALSLTLSAPLFLLGPSWAEGPARPQDTPIPADVDLAGSFTLRVRVRLEKAPDNLPTLVTNKAWESGEVRDYTTNNAYGLGRESGSQAGFALSVLPDGAWTWNIGDGRGRLDHRPDTTTQGIADGSWHEVGFAVDRGMGVAHLFHDGKRVALYDLNGVGRLGGMDSTIRLGTFDGLGVDGLRIESGVVHPARVAAEFTARFGEERAPTSLPEWNKDTLDVLAWNIWHGGRRKGPDEGVQRVVEIIQESGADIVLMQETYGSGPRIADRLGFEFYLRSTNLSVLSRYPIRDVHRLFSSFYFGGATIELRPGLEIQAYSLWIDYLPDVGKALTEGTTGDQLAAADAETRGKRMDAILGELLPHLDAAPAVPVVVGGDFNSGSHLDWIEDATHLENHFGHVVPWPVSRSMARAGYVDTYRTAHSDPVTHPGLTWSPEFPEDHQDRIDYVYASPGDWRVVDSKVLDTHPRGWPSDHAAVLTTLELSAPAPALDVMSYNIHYGIGMDGVYDLERIARVIQAQDPDLVGLQEISNRAMADELASLTGMQSAFGASKGSDDAYGDAILSKHPFTWVGNESLPSASSSRYQAMAVDVDLSAIYGEGAAVRFVNTHFDWTDSLGSQESRRAASQVIERAFFTQHPDTPRPPVHALLTGDLNAHPGSAPLLDLTTLGWHLPGLGQPMLTHGAPDPTQQIDYVLTRPNIGWKTLDALVLDEPVASDHYPVLLTLRPIR